MFRPAQRFGELAAALLEKGQASLRQAMVVRPDFRLHLREPPPEGPSLARHGGQIGRRIVLTFEEAVGEDEPATRLVELRGGGLVEKWDGWYSNSSAVP